MKNKIVNKLMLNYIKISRELLYFYNAIKLLLIQLMIINKLLRVF
jgi:hypothetical protein